MNIKNTEDRRVRKSKQALRKAFRELITEKPLKYITIKELVERADLNRSTFYHHYKDIPDMFAQLEQELYDELSQVKCRNVLERDSIPELQKKTYQYIYDLCRKIKENAELFECILNKNGDLNFVNRCEELLASNIMPTVEKALDDSLDVGMLYHFLQGGCLGIIKAWANSGFSESIKNTSERLFYYARGLIVSHNQLAGKETELLL